METQLFLPLSSLHFFSIFQDLVLVLFLLLGNVELHHILRFFQILEQALHPAVVLLPFVERRFHALTDHPVKRPHWLPLSRFHFFEGSQRLHAVHVVIERRLLVVEAEVYPRGVKNLVLRGHSRGEFREQCVQWCGYVEFLHVLQVSFVDLRLGQADRQGRRSLHIVFQHHQRLHVSLLELLHPPAVQLPLQLLLNVATLALQGLQSDSRGETRTLCHFRLFSLVDKLGGFSFERYLLIVIQVLLLPQSLDLLCSGNVLHSGHLQLPQLLQLRQSPCLFYYLLPLFSLGLLALRVSETHPHLRQHFLLVLVHINGVQTRRFCLGIGVDLPRPQLPEVLRLLQRFPLRDVQQFLVSFIALGGRAADKRSDGPPLTGKHPRQLQQFLVFGPGPFCLFDGGVKPLVPALLALLGGLALQERTDTRPLVQPVFHYRRLQDLVFGVLPNSPLHYVPHRNTLI